MATVALLRRMFDIDAQPGDIGDCLSGDALLQSLVERFPGVRSPTFASPFEACVRAVLGQQVSTLAARRLCADIVASADERLDINGESLLVFPGPETLSAVPDSVLRMPGSRRHTLRAVCELFTGIDAEDSERVLSEIGALKGIGPWTVALLAMRGYGHPDCFPDSDLGLLKAAGTSGIDSRAILRSRSATWQPWRSYAANLLWRSLSHG
jgi:AraC family transcriptional regulator of adaptative response / DNA-3-methyladenine glycosylase II